MEINKSNILYFYNVSEIKLFFGRVYQVYSQFASHLFLHEDKMIEYSLLKLPLAEL
jgi:hypothetical protein